MKNTQKILTYTKEDSSKPNSDSILKSSMGSRVGNSIAGGGSEVTYSSLLEENNGTKNQSSIVDAIEADEIQDDN